MTAPAAPFEPDALDPTLYVRGVAHDVFRWMRENDPVHRDEINGIWVVSKYEDVSYVERQPELFCSGQGVRPEGRRRRRAVDRLDGRPGARAAAPADQPRLHRRAYHAARWTTSASSHASSSTTWRRRASATSSTTSPSSCR